MEPFDEGGTIARSGFEFQDYAAANYILRMVVNREIREVWCERLDDITILAQMDGGIRVEFIQVKRHQLDQLWTVSKLCATGEQPHSSIIEKSLRQDQCAEPTRFRVVSSRDVVSDLSFLKHEVGSPARNLTSSQENGVIAQISERLPSTKSPKGNGPDYWVRNAHWQVWPDAATIALENHSLIRRFAETNDQYLFSDQIEQIHELLLARVLAASAAPMIEKHLKRFSERDMSQWLQDQVQRSAAPGSAEGGKLLQEKMLAAGIPSDAIDNAKEIRMKYRAELLQPRYAAGGRAAEIDAEVKATLQTLRARLDANAVSDTGPQFHSRCLDSLSLLHERLGNEGTPDLHYLQGSMYNITDRCLHRFIKAQP